jgi:hypothetical protein
MLMTAAAAGELNDNDGVNISFCLVTGRPPGMNYKQALLKPRSAKPRNVINPHAHRSVPEARRSVDMSHIMKQSKGGCINPNWILLDNQSTVDVFYNHRLLRNIRKVNTWMDVHCNAGVTSTNLQGEVPGYGMV